MLIALRQAMGRLQRAPTDIGEMHLLDSRLYVNNDSGKFINPELKRRIWHFASLYGEVVQNKKNSTPEITERTIVLDDDGIVPDWI